MISRLLEGNKRFVSTLFAKEKEYFTELARGSGPRSSGSAARTPDWP